MLDYEALCDLAKECGFNACGPLDASTLQFEPEVRDMCAANLCGFYGKNWACPPACGPIEEFQEKVKNYTSGIIVETIGQLKNSLDWDAMIKTAQQQSINFYKLWDRLEKDYPNLFPMGAGTCTKCAECTYLEGEPCRFPERKTASMEACGLYVSQVCAANDIPYYHGENTIAYVGCFLLE